MAHDDNIIRPDARRRYQQSGRPDTSSDTVDVIERITTRDLHGYFDWCVFTHRDIEEHRVEGGETRNIVHFCGRGSYSFAVVKQDQKTKKGEYGWCAACHMPVPEHVDTLGLLAEEKARDHIE